jgi:hypothetical protein
MKTMNRPVVPVLLASIIGAATGFMAWGTSAAAEPVALEKTVVALVAGSVGGSHGPAEAVVFSGQASITGKVLHDTVFRAPPVLEIVVDLSKVTGKGVRTGKIYQVASQTVLHRPLVAFDPVEITFPFVPDGNVLQARSAMASFGVYYSAAKGMTTTPMVITAIGRS